MPLSITRAVVRHWTIFFYQRGEMQTLLLLLLAIMTIFNKVKGFVQLQPGTGSLQACRPKHHQQRSTLAMMAKKKREMPPNPVAVVTGASRGIGKAIALALGSSLRLS